MRIGKRLHRAFRTVGQKAHSTARTVGSKIVYGLREGANGLDMVDNNLQSVKGLAVLAAGATGPYAGVAVPAVAGGIAAIHGANQGVHLGRRLGAKYA